MLLLAALLKGYQLATGPVLGDGLLASRPLLIPLVEFEWFLGLWMLAGLYPKRTWQVALACFSAFACVSLYKGLAGEASCGCFGQVEVSPWYTLGLDLAAVLALLVWPPRECEFDRGVTHTASAPLLGFSRVGIVLTVALLVGVPGAVAMATFQSATLSEDGMIVGPGNVVVLEPEKWVGKRFPLLRYIDIGEQLAHGEWLVVLYRHGCPKCQELLAELAKEGTAWRMSASGRTALIEMPPFGNCLADRLPSRLQWGRLVDRWKWFVETPVELTLTNGRVLDAAPFAETSGMRQRSRNDRLAVYHSGD